MSAEEHVRRWLGRKQTGCGFAAVLANSKAGLAMGTFSSIAAPATVDVLFDYAAEHRQPAIGVFTCARTEPEVVDQLLALAEGERWRIRRVPTPAGLQTDDAFVSIEWRAHDETTWSSPMGLGPFGTMPATRRAPYTVIAAWTGGHSNTFRKQVQPVVHFLDCDLSAHAIDDAAYREIGNTSKRATAEILFDDSAGNYRNVAFRLSVAAASRLATLPLA